MIAHVSGEIKTRGIYQLKEVIPFDAIERAHAATQAALLAALEDALDYIVQVKIAGQSNKIRSASDIPAPFVIEGKIRAAIAAAKGEKS